MITTALIPGKPAPLLLPETTVCAMMPGAVIIDLAAEMGGNCEFTQAGEEAVHHGVVVIGPLDLPSTAPTHASEMYSRNVQTFVKHLVHEGELRIDLEDEIIGPMCITHDGEVQHAPTRELLEKR